MFIKKLLNFIENMYFFVVVVKGSIFLLFSMCVMCVYDICTVNANKVYLFIYGSILWSDDFIFFKSNIPLEKLYVFFFVFFFYIWLLQMLWWKNKKTHIGMLKMKWKMEFLCCFFLSVYLDIANLINKTKFNVRLCCGWCLFEECVVGKTME